jgi:hypothetical protein
MNNTIKTLLAFMSIIALYYVWHVHFNYRFEEITDLTHLLIFAIQNKRFG